MITSIDSMARETPDARPMHCVMCRQSKINLSKIATVATRLFCCYEINYAWPKSKVKPDNDRFQI